MGSLSSKQKIDDLILESLKRKEIPDVPISKIEPLNKIEEENYQSIQNSFQNYEEDDNIDTSDLISKNIIINERKKRYPENCIGQIIYYKNGRQEKKTGSIIGENFILTLASNLYDFQNQKYYSNIKFIDSNNKTHENPKIKIFEDYKTSNSQKDNFGILIFKENISNNCFLGIHLHENLYNIDLNIYGYDLEDNLCQATLNIENKNNQNFFVSYDLKLKQGEEGAPIIENIGNKYYIIGLNLQTNEEPENSATLINKDIIKFINNVKINDRKFFEEEEVVDLKLSNKDLSSYHIEFLKEFNLINLRFLDLTNNYIKTKGIFYLSKAKFNGLKILILDLNEIGDKGLKYLSEGNFRNLTHLSLFSNNISSKGINYLININCKQNLLKLDLSENPKISDEGINNFLSVDWPVLNTLIINKINLSKKGLEYFQRCNIRKIFLKNNNIKKDALTIIQSLKYSKVIITGNSELDE